MFEWLEWFTRMENSKIFALILFFVVFCAILLYVFTGRSRGKRLESYKYIPFDDEGEGPQPRADHKVKHDGRGQDDQASK